MVQTAFALQIEAPEEIAGAVLMYSKEAGAENRNMILKVSTIKSENCDAFFIKLISPNNGKTVKEVENCITELPNADLQNGIFKVFGHPVKTESQGSGGIKTALIGTAFIATGLLLYYSKPPEPVYKISEVSK
jgi:hypothetical protein